MKKRVLLTSTVWTIDETNKVVDVTNNDDGTQNLTIENNTFNYPIVLLVDGEVYTCITKDGFIRPIKKTPTNYKVGDTADIFCYLESNIVKSV